MNMGNYEMGNCRARISIEPTGGARADGGGAKRTWRRGTVDPTIPASTGGLEAPPSDFGVARPEAGHRWNSTGVYVLNLPKCDYEPMAEKAFTGRFAFYNGRHSKGKSCADTLALTMKTKERVVLFANSCQHGKWRTRTLVRILQAFCDGKTCYVETERA